MKLQRAPSPDKILKELGVPLKEECGSKTMEITASGSPEAGPHPMFSCEDDPDCI
jgi:hypothetical protein